MDLRSAPRIKTSSGDATTAQTEKEFLLGDVVYLPGTSTIEALIPGINYGDALAILNAQMEELEQPWIVRWRPATTSYHP